MMLAVFAVLLGSSTAVQTQEALPSAELVLAQFERLMGDPVARDKVHTLRLKGTAHVPMMPGEAAFEYRFLGERARLEMNYPGMPPQTQGTTGTMTWSEDPALGIAIEEGEGQGFSRRVFDIERHVPTRRLYVKSEVVARDKVGDVDCFKLKMTPKTGKDDYWYLEAKTGRLFRIDGNLPDMMGGELAVSFEYHDWKPVGDFPFAHRKIMRVGVGSPLEKDLAIEYRYQSIEPGCELRAEDVAPPPAVVAAWKDPSLRARSKPITGGEVAVETLKVQPTATIRIRVKQTEVSGQLAVILPEVMSHITAVGASMAGPPFARYHSIDGDMVDLEAGMPVREAIEAKGRITASELPGGKAATIWHVGDYAALPSSAALLKQWIEKQELRSSGGFWEVYWTDPGIEPDPAKYRTQILWLIE